MSFCFICFLVNICCFCCFLNVGITILSLSHLQNVLKKLYLSNFCGKSKNYKTLIWILFYSFMRRILLFFVVYHGKQSNNFISVFLLLFRSSKFERLKDIFFLKKFLSQFIISPLSWLHFRRYRC